MLIRISACLYDAQKCSLHGTCGVVCFWCDVFVVMCIEVYRPIIICLAPSVGTETASNQKQHMHFIISIQILVFHSNFFKHLYILFSSRLSLQNLSSVNLQHVFRNVSSYTNNMYFFDYLYLYMIVCLTVRVTATMHIYYIQMFCCFEMLLYRQMHR